MKCVYVGFSLSKTAVIFPKNTVEFLFNGGSIIFIRVTLAEVQGERVIITNFAKFSIWPAWQALKGNGEGGIWAREGERKGTPARRPLFSPFFTVRL